MKLLLDTNRLSDALAQVEEVIQRFGDAEHLGKIVIRVAER